MAEHQREALASLASLAEHEANHQHLLDAPFDLVRVLT